MPNLAGLRWKVFLRAFEIVEEVPERGRATVRRGSLTSLLISISDCEDSTVSIGIASAETVDPTFLSIVALLGKKCLSRLSVSVGNDELTSVKPFHLRIDWMTRSKDGILEFEIYNQGGDLEMY